MDLIHYYEDIYQDGPNAWITEYKLDTIFADNPEYEDFVFSCTGQRVSGSNYTNLSWRFYDTAATPAEISTGYYHIGDNQVGTYRAISEVLNNDMISMSTLGTNNSRDNFHQYFVVRKPMVSGVNTSWEAQGGGAYQGSSTTDSNSAMQYYDCDGYLDNTGQVGGIAARNRYSAWTQQNSFWIKIEIYGIKK